MRGVYAFLSVKDFHGAGENPYHDRLEDSVLTFTAAGKLGDQTLAGVNNRLIQQKELNFPIHGFVLTASRRNKSVGSRRWEYLGLLEYLRHYPDTQVDADGKVRTVWLFEFKIHCERQLLPLAVDGAVSAEILSASKLGMADNLDDDIVHENHDQRAETVERIEKVRSKLLAMEPKRFEFFIKELLLHCGFLDVCVTRYSSDGGIDVNARTGSRIWIFENTLVQVRRLRDGFIRSDEKKLPNFEGACNLLPEARS